VIRRNPSTNPRRKAFEYLNRPGIDKVRQFELFSANQIQCPVWTTQQGVAGTWEGDICARTLTNSSQGKGLVICNRDTLVPAPLYTQYVKKKYEFRTQVFEGQALRTTIKLKKRDAERQTTQIRNLSNGFIFANVPDNLAAVKQQVEELAIRACAAVGYRYGAVDIVYNEHHGQAYVLEVNSAPAMEGTTLEVYTNAICS